MNTLEFLTNVYGQDPGLLILNVSRVRDGGGTYYVTHQATTIAGMARKAFALDDSTATGEGVYHRITTLAADWSPDCGLTAKACKDRGECRRTHRGSAAESYRSPGVFFDVDVSTGDHKDTSKPDDWPAFRAVLDEAGMPAETSLVASGGGFYPGWLHPELVDLTAPGMYERYAAVQKNLHHLVNVWSQHLHTGKLDSTFDLARVLRVPGTRNRKDKYGPDGALCAVVHFDGPRYTLEELESVLTGATYPPGAGPLSVLRSARTPSARSPYEGEFATLDALSPVTEAQAWERIGRHLDKCRRVGRGDGANGTFGGAARSVARYVGVVPDLTDQRAYDLVVKACRDNPYQDPGWYGADGNWTIEGVVREGLDRGLSEPAQFRLVATTAETMVTGAPAVRPDLEIGSPAKMMEWLKDTLGAGHLAGMFNRGGAVVYTPSIGVDGYVPPQGADDSDGPMQVRPITKVGLAAHVQFSYQCFKMVEVKGEDGKKTGEQVPAPAQFPASAAEYAISAADMMPHLRRLRGVTHTPIMRKDGTILDRPGFDEITGLLYAPSAGLAVEPVPATPSGEQVAAAREHVLGLVSDFPFVTASDRANWVGMMLTPLMREIVVSDRKLFAINAHQAGSGKTLLAQIAQYTHGAVFRSALPEDETEMRKWVTGVLETTTAPMVIADNVTGTLRSAFLAGVLTSKVLADRVLGETRNVEVKQDRMWVITGNNVQIGADISRRLVTIAIDPNVERPEERTGFTIENLHEYAQENRGKTLHALLTLMRHWIVSGRPMPAKAQSDSFTAWESAVSGILTAGGFEGVFNAAESKTEVKDVDKDDFALFLAAAYEIVGAGVFRVADLAERSQDVDYRDPAERAAKPVLLPEHMPSKDLADGLARWGKVNAKSLGRMLGFKDKQWFGGYRVVQQPRTNKGYTYVIERIEH